MPNIDLSILNQRQTPAFFADTLANRPAPSFVGRIFISTDTLDLYRDTGTAWLLLSPSSTGTITGSGAAGQVTYFSAASSITGSNDLFWDSVNGHLGIGTNVPGTALNIFHDQNQIIQLNQTTATNDTKIAFQNNGVGLWRIGNSYNAGANDFAIYDNIGAIQQFTIKKTTGQTFIGAETTSSGRLVVNSATGDNHIVVIGATAPSIRVRNAGTSPTIQFGLGLSTATNNFIQGSASGDFCIFNSSTTASPILFGIYNSSTLNVEEGARVSSSKNFLIGTTTDSGEKLQVNGTSKFTSSGMTLTNPSGSFDLFINRLNTSTSAAINLNTNSVNKWFFGLRGLTNDNFYIFNQGVGANNLTLDYTTGAATFSSTLQTNGNAYILPTISGGSSGGIYIGVFPDVQYSKQAILMERYIGAAGSYGVGNLHFCNRATADPNLPTLADSRMVITSGGNVLIGTTTDAGYKLQVNGYIYTNQSLLIANTNIQYRLHTGNDGIELSAGVGGVYLDYGMTSWGSLSDERLKNIDSEILNATKSLMTLRTIRYSLKEDKRNKINLGLIAQDVIKVFPEAVDIQNNEMGTMGVRYTELIPVLVKAIQELNTKIENLK
jgi:hypothetical protein